MPAAHVAHLSVTRPSEELRTNVRRVYGHRAECKCGWKGEVRDRAGVAAWDALEHNHREHKV